MIQTPPTFTWAKLNEAPDGPGVYAWYVRLFLGDADLRAFESEVEAKRDRADGQANQVVSGMLDRHFFHPFQETPYKVRLDGPLKPKYRGELAHESSSSEGLVERLVANPSRLRPIANVLNLAAPFFTAPLYIGMATNLRHRLLQHKGMINDFADNPGLTGSDEGSAGFAKQVIKRGFNPTQLFVACIPIEGIDQQEQVDLENILNRINFPIFGRN
ncbi:hypothetical protein [Dyella sp. GSA-30]|uniref:hypothetical protein n=1 Tax=Dyella sp. GSA-30 TaxID=2994496 RepID=UPI00249196F5|nr:hypothetical protein [Dyella sp. GSA-30]